MGIGASKSTARGMIISFDALGTLYRFRQPVATQYLSVAKKCGLKANISTEELDQSFRTAFKSTNSDHPNYGKETLKSPENWWTELVQRTFRGVVKDEKLPDDLGSALYDHFSSGAAYELYPDVKPFLQQTHELRKQLDMGGDDPILLLGVITNSDPRVKKVLESMSLSVGITKQPVAPEVGDIWNRAKEQQSGQQGGIWLHTVFRDIWSIRRDFDFVATSYDADAEKPDSQIFNYAANLAKLNSVSRVEQVREGISSGSIGGALSTATAIVSHRRDVESMQWIHVGDDFQKDYLGAKASAIDAFHLVREGDGQKPVEGAQTITNLIELMPIVNVMVQQNLLADGKKS